MTRLLPILTALFCATFIAPAFAQEAPTGPLRIEITEGQTDPLPFAAPTFLTEGQTNPELAQKITDLVIADLTGTGLMRQVPPEAYISPVTEFSRSVAWADWKAANVQALISGLVEQRGNQLTVKFRLFDIFAEAQLGDGMQMDGTTEAWRRMAHKIADQVYARLTGEGPYFDSRIVFVAESGALDARVMRLGIMDYDGANLEYLTEGEDLVLAPRMSPGGHKLLFTHYTDGTPGVAVMDLATAEISPMPMPPEALSFSPRFAPDGTEIIFSMTRHGNTDIYTMGADGSEPVRLTEAPAIDAAPGFSPDGARVVFESDRSGTSQLYILPRTGGDPIRISQGEGRYGAPVWSPRGDLIAFVKQLDGESHIGVMRTDGSEERIVSTGGENDAPTWAPNGRVLVFTRYNDDGQPALWRVDITGNALTEVATEGAASDATWGPVLDDAQPADDAPSAEPDTAAPQTAPSQ